MITIVAQGKFHSENIAKVLKKKKLLTKYILFYYSRLISKTLKKNTYCTNLLFLFYKVYIKIFKKDPPEKINWFLKKRFENYVLNNISNEKIIHIWPDCSEQLNDYCKKKSIVTVCEASSAHPKFKKKIVDKEYKKFKLPPQTFSRKVYEDQIKFFKKTDYFMAPSRFVINSLLKNNISKNKILYNPFGVDTKFFSRKKNLKKNKKIKIVSVGDFDFRKGSYYILKAFNKIKDENLELHFIGNINDDLRHLCKKELSDRRVKLLGTMNKINLRNKLNNYDIFCLASVEEGMSISMLEGMSMSLVPLCSENTGAKDIIKNGYDGFIFKIRDINALKNKIILLNNNPRLLEQMKIRIRKKICKNFSKEEYQKRILVHYKKIISKNN